MALFSEYGQLIDVFKNADNVSRLAYKLQNSSWFSRALSDWPAGICYLIGLGQFQFIFLAIYQVYQGFVCYHKPAMFQSYLPFPHRIVNSPVQS